MSGITTTMSNPRKCLRISEILKSNKMVQKIMVILQTQFINPFRPDLDEDALFNLVSWSRIFAELDNSPQDPDHISRG